ncbi:MAG TPA: FAD-binding protein [Rhodoglobus sp.]|nr:FAD-binding protein [Rhodoglobus sp.]
MGITTDADAIARELKAAGVGEALRPSDPAFVTELTGFNLAIAHAPAVVVPAVSDEEVVAAVRVAAALDLRVAVLGLGHGMRDGVEGGILISTRRLASVNVDETTRTATVAAGTTWQQVLDAAAPAGLAPLCGSAPHVGVVGYVLGGGLGPVARTFGFAADHVRSMEVVTADGRLVTADRDEHPDLFWALRGGKVGLGIVTSITIDLFPLRSVYGGGLYFSAEDAAVVLDGFAEITADLPESVSASVAMLRLPPVPALPEVLRGRFVVHVRVVVVGDRAEAERLVAPFRDLAVPLIDTVGELPYAAIGSVHADPVEPMPFTDGGMLLSAFDPDAVKALLGVAGPGTSAPLAAVEVRVLGGAIARSPAVPNAVGGRTASHSVHIVGAPVPELLDGPVPDTIRAVLAALEPWASGETQANFFGRANDPDAFDFCWPDRISKRLGIVRGLYDPTGRFRTADAVTRI